MSKGEEKIILLLKKGRYKFEREKHFSDLKQGKYRFDFYIQGVKPCLIEFQGRQHYEYVAKFYRNRAQFEAQKERDRRKISYCLAHNIPIYIIPYWELDYMFSAADLFQERFLAKTRWKNDQDWKRYKNLTNRQ